MHLLRNASTAILCDPPLGPKFPHDEASVKILPDWQQWPAMLQDLSGTSPFGLTPADVRELRGDMVRAALQWHAELMQVAARHNVDLPLETKSLCPFAGTTAPIVATGHQPHVFHCGTMFKYELAAKFGAEQSAAALAIVLDTDRGDAGRFAFPVARHADNTSHAIVSGLAYATLSTPASLFMNATILPAPTIDEVRRRVVAQLDRLDLQEARETFESALGVYQRLAGVPVSVAHSLARHRLRRAHEIAELPLSRLCQLSLFKRAMLHVVRDIVRFHECYNRTLREWQLLRHIRNRVNPFPPLKQRGDWFELPLWVIDPASDERRPLWVDTAGNVRQLATDDRALGNLCERADDWPPELATNIVAPRGGLITTLLRTLCCDLFLHGLRGESYDGFTNALIANYCGVPSPRYAVVSTSRHLFAAEHHRLQLAAHDQAIDHYINSHPEALLAQPELSVDQRDRLLALIERRTELLEQLRARRARRQSARDEFLAIRNVRHEVAALSSELNSAALPWSASAREAIHYRTYPWFLHSAQDLTTESVG